MRLAACLGATAQWLIGAVLVVGVVLAIPSFMLRPSSLLGPSTDPPPVVARHEGKVTKIIVTDPHEGGWSGNRSNPTSVVITVDAGTYDLDGNLKQAATARPGDTVVVTCRHWDSSVTEGGYDTCQFDGIVLAAMPNTTGGHP